MNSVVLDASVVLRWVLDDADEHPGASRMAEGLMHGRVRVMSPDALLPEIAEVLIRAIRAGRLTSDTAQRLLIELAKLSLDEASPRGLLGDSLGIALEHGMTVQSAHYVALARRTGAAFVSADGTQLQAAVQMGLRAIALDEVPPLVG